MQASTIPASPVQPKDLRVILWDIDGTLLRSRRAEAFKDYTVPVLEDVFGTAGRLHEMSVSGMTDLQIVGEALCDEGFTHEGIRGRVEELRLAYTAAMERAASVEGGEPLFQLLPGAREALERIATIPRYRSALVTGNIEPAEHLKLKLVGLSHFFTLPGAFGDMSHDRRDLPAIAAKRISCCLRIALRPPQFIVVGDTPNDILCARHFGARAVAVATGRSHTPEELLEHNPDALLPDLSNTDLLIRTLDKL